MADQLLALVKQVRAKGLEGGAEAALQYLLDASAVDRARKGSGRRRSTSRGSKAKGRAGVVAARAWILNTFGTLAEDDILIQTTSVGGSDLHYSPKVREAFPFAPEIKNVEVLNPGAALAQAAVNARKKMLGSVLFFRRNNSPLYIAFPADDLSVWLWLLGVKPREHRISAEASPEDVGGRVHVEPEG